MRVRVLPQPYARPAALMTRSQSAPAPRRSKTITGRKLTTVAAASLAVTAARALARRAVTRALPNGGGDHARPLGHARPVHTALWLGLAAPLPASNLGRDRPSRR